MNLDLNTFNKNMTADERKAKSILGRVHLAGPISNDKELTKNFLEMMDLILKYYEFDYDCILKLKDENCNNCNKKLKRKDIFRKEINFPNGSSMILDFYRYSCPHCKEPVDRKLSKIFEPNKQYSKNIKSDAVRLYSTHLSSYEAVTDEINKLYCKNISKKTVISWLKEAGFESEKITLNDDDFSGYIVYDEEFTKVFNGSVGVKDSTLERVDYYLLLFRDAITKKVIIKFADNLQEKTLLSIWKEVFIHLTDLGVEIKAFGTDGKREYKKYIRLLNQELNLNIEHVYDSFHFCKNLYESANEEIFGQKQTKKMLPDLIIEQIKMIENFFSSKTLDDAKDNLNTLLFEKEYFIKGLRKHIYRLKQNFRDYTYFLEIPEMKTTNLCEGWFSRTKPKKLKREYKTKKGIKAIANMIAVRINYNWKEVLDLNFDITLTLNAVLGLMKTKYQ
jgi:hypothetical protein